MLIKKFFDFLSKFHYDKIYRYSNKLNFDVFIDIGAHQGEFISRFLKNKKINKIYSFLNRVIRAAYDLLGLQTYFTAGKKEVRAWTIRKGDSASRAAGVIHTDFEKGFIRAEVISFEDYVELNGEAGAKEAGKMRLEGKDYLVADGDVMHFRFNV